MKREMKKKKGFTLVEIIVVLVILAVLAAVTIPSMLGFVDEARGKTQIANARAVYLACQMQATQDAASGNLPDDSAYTQADTEITNSLDNDIEFGTGGATFTATVITTGDNTGKISDVVFTNDNWTVTLSDLETGQGTTTVTEGP